MTTLFEAWAATLTSDLSAAHLIADYRVDEPLDLAKLRTVALATPCAGVRPTLLGASVRAQLPQEIPPAITRKLEALALLGPADNVLYSAGVTCHTATRSLQRGP